MAGLSRRTLGRCAIAAAASILGSRLPKSTAAGERPFRAVLPGLAADREPAAGPPPPATLKGWADLMGIRVGAPIIGGVSPKLVEVGKSDFNLSNIWMSWNEPVRGDTHYLAMEGAKFARSLGMATVCSGILAPGFTPDWVRNGGFTKSELLSIIRSRVEGVMKAGNGLFDAYLVVNEAGTSRDIFYEIVGPEYVDFAFDVARNYSKAFDPSVKLIYNDYANNSDSGWSSSRLEHTVATVDRLKSKLLVDAVGVEFIIQLNGEVPSQESVRRAFTRFHVPVIVSEFQVLMHGVPGSREERFAKQAKVYGDMLTAVLESRVCNTFIIGYLGDKYSWWETSSDPASFSDNDPTPFDDDFSPKPAYYAMLEALRQAAIARGVYSRIP